MNRRTKINKMKTKEQAYKKAFDDCLSIVLAFLRKSGSFPLLNRYTIDDIDEEDFIKSITRQARETHYNKLEPNIYGKIAQALQHVTPILDVGCGDGRLVNFLAMNLEKKIFGVDVSSVGFEKAKREAELKNVSSMVKCVKINASRLALAFENKFFGGIVSVYALHEFEDPLVVLREIRRVLKTGGIVVIVDFVKGGDAERLWGEKYYTPTEIESMLKYGGFKEPKISFLYKDVILISAIKESRCTS